MKYANIDGSKSIIVDEIKEYEERGRILTRYYYLIIDEENNNIIIDNDGRPKINIHSVSYDPYDDPYDDGIVNDIKLIDNLSVFKCNNGEILEDIGTMLKVCYECYKYSEKLEYGVCEQCI
jgi:hypothetical protein